MTLTQPQLYPTNTTQAWARSREKIAPARAEQILAWMEKLRD